MRETNNVTGEQLVETVVNAIHDGKGEDVRSLDLRELPQAMADHFVVCHANSHTQVKAIARKVEEKTLKELNEGPWHIEGVQNAEWILLDYTNVIVHIFYKEARPFYALEDLWADAAVEEYEQGV